MADAKHVYLVVLDFVHRNVRPERKNNFPSTRGKPETATVRESAQRGNAVINGTRDAKGSLGIILPDAVDD